MLCCISIAIDPLINIIILVMIMLLIGAFGGFINFFFNFDPAANLTSNGKYKYMWLGIAGSFLIPLFLVISNKTDILEATSNFAKPSNYLIFSSYCLISAIFSRTFIRVIGDKLSEEIKRSIEESKRMSQESLKSAEEANLNSVQAKSAAIAAKTETLNIKIDKDDIEKKIELNSLNIQTLNLNAEDVSVERSNLSIMMKTFENIDNIETNSETRLKQKADLGRQMGEIIIRNRFDKEELFKDEKSDAMLFAIIYSVILKPAKEDLVIIKKIAQIATHIVVKYRLLVAFDSLLKAYLIEQSEIENIKKIINSLSADRDEALKQKLDETKFLLSNYILQN